MIEPFRPESESPPPGVRPAPHPPCRSETRGYVAWIFPVQAGGIGAVTATSPWIARRLKVQILSYRIKVGIGHKRKSAIRSGNAVNSRQNVVKNGRMSNSNLRAQKAALRTLKASCGSASDLKITVRRSACEVLG